MPRSKLPRARGSTRHYVCSSQHVCSSRRDDKGQRVQFVLVLRKGQAMRCCGFPVVLLMLAVSGVVLLPIGNQDATAQAPESWRQLWLPDFVREITALTSGTEPLAETLWTEIRSQSAERLLSAVTAGTAADYGDLVSLYLWGRPQLTPEQAATVLAGLRPQTNQVSAWTFEQMQRAGPDGRGGAARGRDSLCCRWPGWKIVTYARSRTSISWGGCFRNSSTARKPARKNSPCGGPAWCALTDGLYTLSICPLDLNFQHQSTFRKQTLSIWLGEQQILDSSQGGWTYQASPVALQTQQATPLRVELSFACSSEGVMDARPAVALLSWAAAGLSKQLVPSARSQLPTAAAAAWRERIDARPVARR